MAQCKVEGNVETHLVYAHVQIVKNSPMQASGLLMPRIEFGHYESLSSPAAGIPTAVNNEVKREATDQSMVGLTHFSE